MRTSTWWHRGKRKFEITFEVILHRTNKSRVVISKPNATRTGKSSTWQVACRSCGKFTWREINSIGSCPLNNDWIASARQS